MLKNKVYFKMQYLRQIHYKKKIINIAAFMDVDDEFRLFRELTIFIVEKILLAFNKN